MTAQPEELVGKVVDRTMLDEMSFQEIKLGNPRFLELLDETRNTHIGKAAGYSGSDNPDTWANFREAIAWGLTPLQGCLVRMGDKYRRIQSLRRDPNNDRVGEPIRDTLMDLANYALIAVCLHEEEEQAKLVDKAGTVMAAVEPERELLPQLHFEDRAVTFRVGSAVEPCFARGHIGGIHVHASETDEGHLTLAVKASGQTR